MEKIITLEEQLIREHQRYSKIIQKVCIFLVIISFVSGLITGIIIK